MASPSTASATVPSRGEPEGENETLGSLLEASHTLEAHSCLAPSAPPSSAASAWVSPFFPPSISCATSVLGFREPTAQDAFLDIGKPGVVASVILVGRGSQQTSPVWGYSSWGTCQQQGRGGSGECGVGYSHKGSSSSPGFRTLGPATCCAWCCTPATAQRAKGAAEGSRSCALSGGGYPF